MGDGCLLRFVQNAVVCASQNQPMIMIRLSDACSSMQPVIRAPICQSDGVGACKGQQRCRCGFPCFHTFTQARNTEHCR